MNIGGESRDRFIFVADEVGENVHVKTSQNVHRAIVSNWASGSFEAAHFVMVRSAGDFGADILNTRNQNFGFGVQRLIVRGDLTSTITADRIGNLRVINGDANITVNIITDAETLNAHSFRGRNAINNITVIGGNLESSSILMQPGTRLQSLNPRPRRGVGGLVVDTAFTGDLNRTNVAGQSGSVTVDGDPVNL